MSSKYGIWGGRFQIIHKGHEYVLKYVAKNYQQVCIGIVNPNPKEPAWSILEHEKFEPERNPFNYFQRAYLWNILLRQHSIEAVIVPHWHPRKSLKMEKTFLPFPQKSREWVIPLLDGEEYKIKDYKNAGEKVYELDITSANFKLISASQIRRLYDNGNKNFKRDIPDRILTMTKKFLDGENPDEQFIIIPILRDILHPLLICSGIQYAVDMGRKLIFAPVVNVKNEQEWWKFEPVDDSYFTFYQKHEIINRIMKHLQFYDYMVIPIIIKNETCQAIDAFFPSSDNRSWIFIKEINFCNAFKEYLRSEDVLTLNSRKISDDIFLEVADLIIDLYRQKHYYDSYVCEREEKGKMPKNDFRNMYVNTFNYTEGNVESGININTSRDSECNKMENIIYAILTEQQGNQIYDLLIKADAMCSNISETEMQHIIETAVCKEIDTPEKKENFIQKIKRGAVNISNSVVAGLILQCVKNLIFKV